MPMIRINLKTREIAVEGPEIFVDDYIDTIKEMMTASFRSIAQQGAGTLPRNKPSITPENVVKPKITAIPADRPVRRRRRQKSADAAGPDALPALAPDAPPVRRYILRKAGTTGKEESTAGASHGGAARVSIESMKEKLGLTEQQVIEVLREAEKQGRVRKNPDGSYVWVS